MIMELDKESKQIIEELANEFKPSDLKIIAKKLSFNYENNPQDNVSLIDNYETAITYSVMRLPATFAAVYRAFEQIFEIHHFKIHKVLDLGAGTGTSALVLSSLFNKDDIDFTLVERNQEMIKIGKEILTHKNINYHYVETDIKKLEISENFDLIIFSYSFNEFNSNDQLELVNKFLPFTKLLVIVDPGTPKCYESLMNIKKSISSQYSVVAPCACKDGCPLKNDWCHFVARLSRSTLHRYLKDGDAPFEDEKFTYLALSNEKVDFNCSRVIRHPLISNNVIALKICDQNDVITKTITKKDKALFKKAKKIKIGDTF